MAACAISDRKEKPPWGANKKMQPALRDPRPKVGQIEGKERWSDQVRTALEARRMGIELRRGKPKSFRPTIGTAA